MPGLLNQDQPLRGTGGPTNTSDGPSQQDVVADGENVSPEEQKMYNEFVTNGMQMLYNEQAMPKLLESIGGDGSPVEGLANALVTLVMRLEDSAAQAGQKISPDVLMHGGTEILEQMVDLAEQAGVHKFEEQEIESALFLAMDMYRSNMQEQGKLPEEQLQADMQEIMAAEQAGTLEDIIPGIGEYAKRAPKPDQVPPTGRGA